MNEQDYIKTLKDYTPDWMRDGTGIRGPAQTVQRFSGGVEFPHASIQQTVQPGNEPLDQPGFGGPTPIGGSSTTNPVPLFQPYFRYSGTTPQWGVYSQSLIFFNGQCNPSDNIIPSGLLSFDFSTGWLDINTGADPDRLWIETTYGTWPALAGAATTSTGSGGSWSGGVWEYESNMASPTTYTQTVSRVLIATCVADGSGNALPSLIHSGGLMFSFNGEQGYDSSASNPKNIVVFHPYPI